MLNRRDWMQVLAASAAACQMPATASGGEFSGKIRKSLKWNMVPQTNQLPLTTAFAKLRDCGFDGVEPHLSHVSENEVEAWVAASRETGLVIDGMVGGRPQNLRDGIERTKQLGGDSLLVVVPYDTQSPLQPQWTQAREQLQQAAEWAAEQQIFLLIENVWATFLISPFDMARFIDEIHSPWVQVHFDVGNMMRWGVAEHWAEILGKRSRKLDIKEYDLELAMKAGMRRGFEVAIGEGSINWPAVRQQLAKLEFSGWAAAEVAAGDWDYLADVARRMDQVLDL